MKGKRWATRERGEARPNAGEEELGRPGQKRIFHFYFVFKTKFIYEPNANSNRVSNILYFSNKNEKFG